MKDFIINEGYQSNKSLFGGGVGSKIILNNQSFLDLSCCRGFVTRS